MSRNNLVSNIAGCCGVALLTFSPTALLSNSSFNKNSENSYYKYADYDKKLSTNNNSQKEIKITKSIDSYENEAKLIINEIKNRLDITIDDKFIPNKSENKVTLFITCKEFRDLCNDEKYDEALDLEMKIMSSISEQLANLEKIERISFL